MGPESPDYLFDEPRRLKIFGSDVAYWDINPDRPETVIMVHGFRGNHLGLRRIIAELTDYRIIIADLPGFGLSTPMTERRHDLVGYSEVTGQLIDHLGIDRLHVFGHSFGSQVAAHLVANRREQVGKFILINAIAVSQHRYGNPWVNRLVDLYYWLGYSLPRPVGEKLLVNQLYARGLSTLLTTSRDPKTRGLILRHHLNDLAFYLEPRVIHESYAASVSEGVIDVAKGLGLAALIIGGELDPIAPVKTQELLASVMPGSELEIVAGVGHLIPLEKPVEAARLIRNYLS